MRRELSAGGAVIRRVRGEWRLAAIRPGGKVGVWALPKGNVYTWEGERIFKVVSFYLFRYRAGALGRIASEHAHEIAEARWLPLADAPRLLSYGGERSIAEKALVRVDRDADPL